MAKTINLGKVGITLGGDYDSSKNYASRTCVFYNHVSWTSKKDVPAGIAPGTNDEYWQKVSERGAQGIQGERGPQGNSAFDGTGIELVNNLTQGGEASALSAEQGKILKTELTELESKVGADVNATIIEFTDNFRFATGASPIDINSKLATSSWRCAIVECSEGEEFAINGKGGGSAAALWTFVDANGNILLQNAEQNPILQKMVIVAPSNAAYLLMNDFKSGAKSYKGVPLSFAVDALDANIVDLKKQGSDNLVHFPTLIISTNYQSLLADANTANDNTIYTIVMSSIPKNFPTDYTFASIKSDQVLLTTIVSSKGDNYEQRSQTISRADGTTIYSRVYVNGAWGTWQKVNAPLEIFPTLIISTNYRSLLADANTAKRNCIYTIEMSAIPNNFPSDYAYASVGGGQPILLKTIANDHNGAEGSIIQEIINSTSGEVVYYRRCSGGTWSDWVKKQSAPTITMYPTFVTTSNIASIVPNADNAADNTMYRIGSRTNPSNFPPHFPSAKAPAIFLETKVVGLSGSTMKYQTIYDENMRALWVRDYNGTWGAWRSIQHFISVSKNGSGEGWSYKSLYEALAFAINNDHTFIEVYDGEYDLIAEMGDDLTDNHNGILLGHDMKLKFHPNAYVTAHYKGDSDNIKSVFSAFMVGEGDFEIDGLNLSCSNIRYCIHDDNARAYSEYKHIYRNCKMLMDNSNNTAWDSKQCIGGGLGESAVIIIDNCFFESVGSENNAEVSYHNCGYGTTARSEIHISNCYFKNSTCRFGYYGNTTNITSCYVSGCRAKQKPYVFRESSGYDKVNMELFEWGNDIQ